MSLSGSTVDTAGNLTDSLRNDSYKLLHRREFEVGLFQEPSRIGELTRLRLQTFTASGPTLHRSHAQI